MNSSLENISKNLKRYRSLRSLSQDDLSRKTGINRVTYSKIESGKEEPKVGTLQHIADALGVDIYKLVSPVPSLESLRFRSKSNTSAKLKSIQEQIRINFAYWLRGYNHLEKELGKNRASCFDSLKVDLKKSPDTKPVAFAKAARKAAMLNEDKGVINDICGLIENAGIKIFPFIEDQKSCSGFCTNKNDGGPAIAVNTASKISTERKIFTVAHELGHILMHPGSFGLKNDTEDKEETEADIFASYFLMPKKEFDMKYKEASGMHPVDRVLFVKRYFKVSYQTVLRRIADRNEHNYSDLIKLFSYKYKEKYGKDLKNHYEPEALCAIDFSEERFNSLVREALDSGKISLHHASELLSIDLIQMRELATKWNEAREEKLEWPL